MSLTMNFIRQKFEFDQQNLFKTFSVVRVGKVNPIQIESYNASQNPDNIKEKENTCKQNLFKVLFGLRTK